MTIGALYTKHQPLARSVASEFHVPGMNADDVRVEAYVALWEACRCHAREQGNLPAHARHLIRRRLTQLGGVPTKVTPL